MTRMEMMLSQKPARIMSEIFSRPVPKTIAFGGVPTGIMNAQLVPIVAQIKSASGCMSSD